MSHFTVVAKVTAARLAKHKGNLKKALTAMLAPYEENPSDELSEYWQFEDMEDKLRKEYATGTTTCYRIPGGGYVSKWDRTKAVPEGSEEVEVPLAERYSFEKFVKEYHGYEIHGGRAGRWHNPEKFRHCPGVGCDNPQDGQRSEEAQSAGNEVVRSMRVAGASGAAPSGALRAGEEESRRSVHVLQDVHDGAERGKDTRTSDALASETEVRTDDGSRPHSSELTLHGSR